MEKKNEETDELKSLEEKTKAYVQRRKPFSLRWWALDFLGVVLLYVFADLVGVDAKSERWLFGLSVLILIYLSFMEYRLAKTVGIILDELRCLRDKIENKP